MPLRGPSTIHRDIASFISFLLVAMLAQILPSAPRSSAQSTAGPAELRISGTVSTPLVREQLRGRAMATYIIAEAEDGYRVVFSLAELDSGILESEVLVADTMGGAPLGAQQGPFRLVAPHDKRPARWVRMLKSITVVGP
jgi:hypothetical protein